MNQLDFEFRKVGKQTDTVLAGERQPIGQYASGKTIDSVRDVAKDEPFIPSHEFFGPEMPLPRAMRQLVTDGYGYGGKK